MLRLRRIAGTFRQQYAKPGRRGGIQFASDIGNEQDLGRCEAERRGDLRVAGRVGFRPGCRVEVAAQESRKIAVGRCGEDELLREDAARRVDPNVDAAVVPAFERRRNVRKDFAAQLSTAVAFLADPALQALQRRRFTIPVLSQRTCCSGVRPLGISASYSAFNACISSLPRCLCAGWVQRFESAEFPSRSVDTVHCLG